jgi:hypothetical protein
VAFTEVSIGFPANCHCHVVPGGGVQIEFIPSMDIAKITTINKNTFIVKAVYIDYSLKVKH